MTRMGHDDMRAALLYQRATSEAAERIAHGIDELVNGQRSTAGKPKRRKGKRPRKGREDRHDEYGDGSAGVLEPVG
jgi:hypothetical protein